MYYSIQDKIIGTHYEEWKKLPVPLMISEIFRHFTEEIPVFFREDDRIAGWYGYEDKEDTFIAPFAYLDPDFGITALSDGSPAPKVKHQQILSKKEKALRKHLADDLKTIVSFSPGHTCIDYQTVIEKGLAFYLEKIESRLFALPEDPMLLAMKSCLESCDIYAKRFAKLADMTAEQTTDREKKIRLQKIRNALLKVPMKPAESFLEAVQSVWIMHTLIPAAEMSWASISIGRMDQYLYPFYQKAIAEGESREEIREILKNVFRLLDSYGDGACALNIGGMDMEGRDMFNELSALFLEVEKEMALRAPILAVRITPKTDVSVWDQLIDFDLFRIGQPTFYNEAACREAVMSRGISEEEAADFSVNSCMGLYLSGREFADMWGIKFNSHLPLELALNDGRPFHCELGFELKTPPKRITCREELFKQYEKYFAELMVLCADLYHKVALHAEAHHPDPLLSALTEGCAESGRDRSVGAKYQTVTVETMGLINTCDAIEAVCELVFERKEYTLEQMIDACRNHYNEDAVMLQKIRSCKKYGMDDENVNAVCKRVSEGVFRACKAQNKANLLFLPSLHTIDVNVGYGADLYATLDGRLSGDPVNKNANPSDLVKDLAHTGHILSAASVCQTKFSGGQPIDLYFHKSWFESAQMRDNIKILIMTYFQKGGLQLQVNSVDIALLEKAHKSPEQYPHVIVRKGGFSVHFTELSREVREEFIEHAKKEEGI